MPVKIQKSKELKAEGKSCIIYGDSGVGKTHALGTLPEGKTLILDIEGGCESIADKNHDVVRIKKLEDLDEIYMDLSTGNLKYRFVAIDSISELEKALQFMRKNAKGKDFMSLKEYGESSELMREYMRKFRDLRFKGISVIFVGLEMPLDIVVSPSITETKAVPMLSKKFALEACGLVDMVARLVITKDTKERVLLFEGDSTFIAKTRVENVNPKEKPDLTDLYRRIFNIKDPETKETK